jgi:hypothetical protein
MTTIGEIINKDVRVQAVRTVEVKASTPIYRFKYRKRKIQYTIKDITTDAEGHEHPVTRTMEHEQVIREPAKQIGWRKFGKYGTVSEYWEEPITVRRPHNGTKTVADVK